MGSATTRRAALLSVRRGLKSRASPSRSLAALRAPRSSACSRRPPSRDTRPLRSRARCAATRAELGGCGARGDERKALLAERRGWRRVSADPDANSAFPGVKSRSIVTRGRRSPSRSREAAAPKRCWYDTGGQNRTARTPSEDMKCHAAAVCRCGVFLHRLGLERCLRAKRKPGVGFLTVRTVAASQRADGRWRKASTCS